MTVEQRADEVRNFFLVLPEKEQRELWLNLMRRAYEERKKQPQLNKDEVKRLARKLDAALLPNDITMDEIVAECREVRKEQYERYRKV